MDKHLPFVIGCLRFELRGLFDARLKQFGLTRYEWLVLACLKHMEGEVTQSRVRNYIGIEESYLAKVLKKLEQKSIITRQPSMKDRRKQVVMLHEKAKASVQKIYHSFDKVNNEILSILGEADKKLLFSLLEKISQHVREELK